MIFTPRKKDLIVLHSLPKPPKRFFAPGEAKEKIGYVNTTERVLNQVLVVWAIARRQLPAAVTGGLSSVVSCPWSVVERSSENPSRKHESWKARKEEGQVLLITDSC
jgi:hypothetical protein